MLTYICRQFAVKKGRTILCLLGVAVSVAMIVSILSMARGMRNSMDTYMKDSGASLVVFDRSAADLAFSKVSRETVDKVEKIPGVDEISRANFTMIMRPKLGRKSTVTSGLGVVPVFGRYFSERVIKKYGEKLKAGRLPDKRSELLLGVLLADKMNIRVGDRFPLFHEEILGINEYEVTGIFETSLGWENLGAVAHADVVQQKSGPDYALIFVYTSPEQSAPTRKRIEAEFPQLIALPAGEFTDRFHEQLAHIDEFIFLLSIIAGIVGVLGVLNTMMMSVSERTREIGTLRAMGWSSRRLMAVIAMEGFIVSITGGFIGMALGWAGTELLIGLFSDGFLMAAYQPEVFMLGFLLAFFVGASGSIYPAVRASSLKPAEALRYE